MNEWRQTKKADISFYKQLSDFFKDEFPDIKLAAELEKETLIADLAASGSFAKTHIAVAKLAEIGEFTAPQANNIVQASVANTQILWIVPDSDVSAFLSDIIVKHEPNLDKDAVAELKPLLEKHE